MKDKEGVGNVLLSVFPRQFTPSLLGWPGKITPCKSISPCTSSQLNTQSPNSSGGLETSLWSLNESTSCVHYSFYVHVKLQMKLSEQWWESAALCIRPSNTTECLMVSRVTLRFRFNSKRCVTWVRRILHVCRWSGRFSMWLSEENFNHKQTLYTKLANYLTKLIVCAYFWCKREMLTYPATSLST